MLSAAARLRNARLAVLLQQISQQVHLLRVGLEGIAEDAAPGAVHLAAAAAVAAGAFI